MIEGEIHIFRGVNQKTGVNPYPCPNCGTSATYLGIYILTVTWLSANYLGTTYQCHNPNCDPIYEKYETEDDEGNEIIYYDLVDFGAYWSNEDDCYFTPQAPRCD